MSLIILLIAILSLPGSPAVPVCDRWTTLVRPNQTQPQRRSTHSFYGTGRPHRSKAPQIAPSPTTTSAVLPVTTHPISQPAPPSNGTGTTPSSRIPLNAKLIDHLQWPGPTSPDVKTEVGLDIDATVYLVDLDGTSADQVYAVVSMCREKTHP
mgnify:CR=1 FL=1